MQSYKFRIYPTKEQEVKLTNMFGCSRFVWNYFLNLNKETYLEAKEKDLKKKYFNYYDCSGLLTKLKLENEWLKVANAQSLQQTLKTLDGAYNKFFEKKSGFPNFKSKRNKQSFRVPQDFKLFGNKIYCPKLKEGIKITVHREVEGNIKFVTIFKSKSGKYFASITTDHEVARNRTGDNQVGIDLGAKTFAVLSNGEKFNYAFRVNDGKLKHLHKKLSNKVRGSNNRTKARIKLAVFYERITNKREDFQHKLSNKICKENELIALEDLNIAGMAKNHNLAKVISNQGWYSFVSKLEYKALRYGSKILKTNRFYPSSKSCFECGFINQELTLVEREWECPSCKSLLDRDLNASKNILDQVMREQNLTVKGGRDYRLKPVELPVLIGALKQEGF